MPGRRKGAGFTAPSPPRRVEMGGEIEGEVDEERRVEAEEEQRDKKKIIYVFIEGEKKPKDEVGVRQ